MICMKKLRFSSRPRAILQAEPAFMPLVHWLHMRTRDLFLESPGNEIFTSKSKK